MNLYSEIQFLKGVGPQRAKILQKIGLNTIFDLLTYFPKDYVDRSRLKLIAQLQDQESASIQAAVIDQKTIITRNRKRLLKIVTSDGTGKVSLVCFNQFYLKDILTKGKTVIVAGKFERVGKRLPHYETTHFTYELLSGGPEDLIHTGRIVPLYPVTERLNMRFLRALIRRTLTTHKDSFVEYIPAKIRESEQLAVYPQAIERIHFPRDFAELRQARKRLIFDEFFLLGMAIALKTQQERSQLKGVAYTVRKHLLTPFKQLLSFEFTLEQKKAIREIFADMCSTQPMNRLLQGDVGCGKTIVALSAMLLTVENGCQAALMAPTEILAEQHYLYLQKYLQVLGLNCVLLTSGRERREYKNIKEKIGSGAAQVIVGTHALLEKDVVFKKLGLVVIDEQHRFGVRQRAVLRQKGANPDVLVMTATPIPRSLALTVYGDLDVTTIQQLPPGRLPVTTLKLKAPEAYEFVRKKISGGQQAYVIYPLIEESPHFTLKAARSMADHLQKDIFPDFRVGLLHGKLAIAEKEKVMQNFVQHALDILVSTTVIEVGIDVSNATVILIEHAERFGLSTLHQLRGRVGRGREQSHCLLVADEKTEEAQSRIRVMLETNDGFKIAEQDLQIRGPGEFFGEKQHGLPELRIGDLIRDFAVLQQARCWSFSLIKEDPALTLPQHRLLREIVQHKFGKRLHLSSIG